MNADEKPTGRAAAFFDLDGTLIPEPSLERRFFSALRSSGAIPPSNILRWVWEAVRLLPKSPLAVQHGNKRYLTGLNRELISRHMESIFFFEEGIARVAWHARQGHEIVLVSGTLEELARMAANALECELEARGVQARVHVYATRLAEKRGEWNGYLIGELMYGTAKTRALEEFAKQEKVELRHCHAYGNSLLDRQLLCTVGYGHAVNPGRDLAALANERDWPIWHWYVEKKLDSGGIGRLAVGIQHTEGQA